MSCNKEVFERASPSYAEALAKSGYSHKLEYDPKAVEGRAKTRSKKRQVTWFNPPFSQNVKIKV